VQKVSEATLPLEGFMWRATFETIEACVDVSLFSLQIGSLATDIELF
jgi:hypothetical protein